METARAHETTDARELARSMDCFTDEEVLSLGKLKPGTLEAWRKRGKGPAYILFGNRYLYPRQAVADFLKSQVRERNPTPVSEAL